MLKSKRNWLLAGLFALCSFGAQASEGPGVTVLLRSGNTVSFTFTQAPRVEFDGDNLVLVAAGSDALTYSFTEVQRMYFEDDVQTAVNEVVNSHKDGAQGKVVFSCQNGTLSAKGLAAGEAVTVYSLSGQKAAQAVAGTDGSLTIPVQQLAAGTYVVKSQNGIGYKIIKK